MHYACPCHHVLCAHHDTHKLYACHNTTPVTHKDKHARPWRMARALNILHSLLAALLHSGAGQDGWGGARYAITPWSHARRVQTLCV